MDFYLKHENISRGTVRKLKCKRCNFGSDCFSIIGDTEAMNFLGIIGLTDTKSKEIFITHLTLTEFKEYKSIDAKSISARLESLLNRDSLVYFKKDIDEHKRPYYSCPKCNSEMVVTNEVTLSDYVKHGGEIYTIAHYPNT